MFPKYQMVILRDCYDVGVKIKKEGGEITSGFEKIKHNS